MTVNEANRELHELQRLYDSLCGMSKILNHKTIFSEIDLDDNNVCIPPNNATEWASTIILQKVRQLRETIDKTEIKIQLEL